MKASEPEFVFDGEYAKIPEMLQSSLLWYVKKGQMTGGFLESVLCNDLTEAALRGDLESRRQLANIALWINFRAPGACHGSKKAYEAWRMQKGLQGVL